MNTIVYAIENIGSPDDCIEALELIHKIVDSAEDSHFYADQAVLKLLEILGYQEIVDAYWDSSDHFWYA